MNGDSFEFTLVTFGAAFAGALFSLLLWFGADAWIRRKREKKLRRAMIQEIMEELQFDIAVLIQLPSNLRQILGSGNFPFKISRLTNSASSYALSSGEIRLIHSVRKRRLVRLASAACERFNEFVDNTERLLAIFTLKDEGLKWSTYRINSLIEQASDTRSLLEDYLSKLQQENLPDEYGEDRMSSEVNDESQSQEVRLKSIESGIDVILKQLKNSQRVTASMSLVTVGIAFIGISLALLSLGSASDAVAIFFLSLVVFAGAAWYYRGRVHLLDIIGALITILGSALLIFTQLSVSIGIVLACIGIVWMAITNAIYSRRQTTNMEK